MHPKEAVILWKSCAGPGSWQELWTHGKRSSCLSRFASRTCDAVENPLWSCLFLKDCAPWKGPILEQLILRKSMGRTLEKSEECHLWEKPHTAAGEECEGYPP